jgi:phage FluMu gp28-like protein
MTPAYSPSRAVLPQSDAVVQEPRLEIVEHIAFSGTAHDALFARVADLLGKVWRVRRVAVDATGLGETLARLLSRRLGDDVVQPVKFTAESKSKLGYGLLAAVNGGRLKMYAADGSPELAEFWREAELARVLYRPSRQMNFFVAPSDGHDDYVVSAALAVHAASDIETRPRVARGRLALD